MAVMTSAKVLLFVVVLIATLLIMPVRTARSESRDTRISQAQLYLSQRGLYFQGNYDLSKGQKTRRMLIGSTAPTCTYECRGCKYRCRAEQIPVDGNDPVNSAYRYKCICHR